MTDDEFYDDLQKRIAHYIAIELDLDEEIERKLAKVPYPRPVTNIKDIFKECRLDD